MPKENFRTRTGDGNKAIFSKLKSTLLIASLAFSVTQANAQSKKFEFGLIGDAPYSRKMEKEFPKVIDQMNHSDLSFVVHVGDFELDPRPYNSRPEGQSMPCVAENFKKVHAAFQTSKHPFILTPGDNDWTDCHLLKAQKVDALDALDQVRSIFYPAGMSLGQNPMPVVSQSADPEFSKYVENLRWSKEGVTFATIHLVGSNNNFGKKPEPSAEFTERAAANVAWLRKAFATAKADNSLGLVLFTQANPTFESKWNRKLLGRLFRSLKALGYKSPKKPEPKRAGFDEFLETLLEEMQNYDKPTVLMHGDTHYFQINNPLYNPKTDNTVGNFTRVETFGAPVSGWIQVTVDPDSANLFSFHPRRYSAN